MKKLSHRMSIILCLGLLLMGVDHAQVYTDPEPKTNLLLLGGVCCLVLFIILGGILFVILFWGRKRKPAPRPAPRAVAAQPQPSPAAPPPANWQGETIVTPSVVVAELVIEEGPDTGQRFSLKPSTRLGRAADNEIVLRDPQVSRHHAVISFTGAEYVISDLGSANGTRVNDVLIDQPCPLNHGDVVLVGSDQLVFRQR